jgi:guanylate kinase
MEEKTKPPATPTGPEAPTLGLDCAFRNPPSALSGPLIVVSGPSGVGKTTVVDRLLANTANTKLKLRRAVTATTREKRKGEIEDISYHFWDLVRFQKAIDDGRMLEWAKVFDRDFYGTPRSEVDPYRVEGIGVILVIDVQGAARVRDLCPDCLSIFITPPSPEELEARLRGRGDLSEERIERRLKEARKEMDQAREFQHQIVNRDLDQAVRDLERVIRERFDTIGG